MKDLNKKLMSLILSGAVVSSVGAAEVSASYDTNAPRSYYEDELLFAGSKNGLYTVMVSNKPIYVYLNNSVRNEFLNKYAALNVARTNYERVYAYSKTVKNPSYIEGYTPYNERYITVYALSDKTYVDTWSRIDIDSISEYDKVATSIELGEFLLKKVDFSNYQYNHDGFVTVDLNRDNYFDEILYLGNNKVNKVMDKKDALRWASLVYGNYYVFKKTVNNPNYGITSYNPVITLYAVENTYKKEGWTLINTSEVPNNEIIATNTEMYDAMIKLNINFEFVKGYNNDYKPIDDKAYVYATKREALEYGYTNYRNFCVLAKVVKNQMLYTLSTEIVVSKNGWEIIANDDIPAYANVFISFQDAINYEYLLNNNNARTLK